MVTSELDDDVANPREGTLRFGAAQNRPLWIIFARDMVIRLDRELAINNDKTIDGRGAKVEIINAGFAIYNVKNIIIHNIIMHDIVVNPGGLIKSHDGPPVPRKGSDGDAIGISGGSQIWIDHCSLSKAVDGLIDAKHGSTHFTVSNCLFTQHQYLLLFWDFDERGMLCTVAFNKFTDNVDQRMPNLRHGFVQVVNNNYERWGSYALGGSAGPTILSQGNRFLASDIKKEVVGRYGESAMSESFNWNWRSYMDVFENGAIFVPSGVDPVLTPEQNAGMIPAEPGEAVLRLTSSAGEAVLRLTSSAGVLSCQPGTPC
ncbi:hypothetical protein M8C21_018028 [Ambrosia artemisiifolia]|uniref:Pectate lyase n=1 Tax=Ambrosia artemisiifolia TaxID=4212 RepID=A0AAD5GHI8_AMBAR|nr:hypothetical protein M8C21_018028 [Ambrosia artemisiifolia]